MKRLLSLILTAMLMTTFAVHADYMTKASYANNAGFTTGEVFARHKEDVASYEAWQAICNEENGVNEAANFIDGENTLELSKAGNPTGAVPPIL